MKARALVYTLVVGLGLVGLGSGVFLSSQSWRRLDDLREGRKLLAVLRPGTRLVEALSVERAETSLALVAGAQAASEDLAARRSASDAEFAKALDRAARLPPTIGAPIERALQRAQADVAAARAQAALAFGAREDERMAAARALLDRYRGADAEVEDAISPALHGLAKLDASIGPRLEISRLAADISDDAGLRSSILTLRFAGGGALSPDETDALGTLAGGLLKSWERMQRLASDAGGETLKRAVVQASAAYFGKTEALYRLAAERASAGAPPPGDLADWKLWTQSRLAETLPPRDAAFDEVADRIVALQGEAERNAALALLGMLARGLVLLIICVYMERRLLRPMAKLARAIDPEAETPADADMLAARFAKRDDEVGALARAVLRVRQHAGDLQIANDRFGALIENLPHGVTLYDAQDVLRVANRRFADIYGFPDVNALIGMSYLGIFDLGEWLSPDTDPDQRERMRQDLVEIRRRETRLEGKVLDLGNGRIVEVHGRRMPDGAWLSTHVDITSQRQAERQIAYIAEHDDLTGLANRQVFARRLEVALRRGDDLAVLCIDLDRFKLVNDRLGHSSGDELLREAARRMLACVGKLDCVARLGGDEFAVLLEAPGNRIAEVAERLIERLSAPYEVGGQGAEIGASVGIARGKADALTPDELLRAADLAMYRAKQTGRGSFRFYEPAMDDESRQRRALEHDLRAAAAAGQLVLDYLPICDVARGEVSAYEAEPHWNHPRRGRISSANLLGLAEDCGLSSEIGAWTLRRACEDAARWSDDIRLCVNVLPRQFKSARFLADLVGALVASGLPPRRLEIEIPERALIENPEAAFGDLRSLGVSLALDGFGAGVSSLSIVRRFPFDRIKLDATCVRDLARDDSAVAVLCVVSGLARALDMRLSATGVETQEQYDRLSQEGCAELQGALIGAPASAEDVGRRFRRGERADLVA